MGTDSPLYHATRRAAPVRHGLRTVRRTSAGPVREPWRRTGLLLILLCGVLWAAAVVAEPQRVRLPEGNARGFLVVRAPDGKAIAHGELVQKPTHGLIESRLRLHFTDGSRYEETVAYSQKQVFRLERYQLVQRGPAFPTTDVAFDRQSGQYRAHTQAKKDGEEQTASGPLELPADLYNGMTSLLLKNLPRGTSTTVQMVAFTPEPRLLKVTLSPQGEEQVRVGKDAKPVTRYLVQLDLGGIPGLIAAVIGKEPPDLRYWLVAGDVPAFVRFEGAMFLNGPVWRLELTTVEWPR
jgi:hypothetical protein